MSNAPKWIADVLEKLPAAVGSIERENIAIEIAEEFPMRDCMAAAAGSLRTQLTTNNVTLPEKEIDAIANNMLQAIGGAVMGVDTDATHIADEWIEMRTLLGNIGAPAMVDGKRLRIAEQLEYLINARRNSGGRPIDP